MNSEPSATPPETPKRSPKFPRSLDPGWATFLAALLALIGTIIIVVYPRLNQPEPAPTATPMVTQSTQPVMTTAAPSNTPSPTSPPGITDTPAVTDTPTPGLTAASSPTQIVIQPTAQIFAQLSESENTAIQPVVNSMLQAAKLLPLIIRDSFDTNDYGWDEYKDTFEKGITCEFALRDSQYHITLTSTEASGGAWCLADAPRATNNFYLAFDVGLSQKRIADIYFYYRYNDENNFYYLILNPQTQTITLGLRQNGVDSIILDRLYVPDIHKDGLNRITLLSIGASQALSINDSGVALLGNAPGFETGQIRIGLQLNEADQFEELLLDNFELRGE